MDNTLDGSLIIQQKIDAAAMADKHEVTIGANPEDENGVWTIYRAIELPSHMTIIIDNCTLRLANGVFCNVFCNARAYRETMNSGDEQSDIHVIGMGEAVLDGGNHNGLVERTSERDGYPHIIRNTMLLLRNVRNFSVKGLTVINPRWWGMTFFYAKEGVISNLTFDARNNAPNQDGIDLRVGCSHITIENISGYTGDDSVALTALSGRIEQVMAVSDEDPDIHDICIKKIRTEVTGGHHIVRLLNHDGNRLYRIDISDIFDRTLETGGMRAKAALKIGDMLYSNLWMAQAGETHSITAHHITTRAQYAVLFENGSVTNAQFTDIKNDEGILFCIR